MENDELRQQQIEHYLNARMTEEESLAFEQQLKGDPSLQAALEEERLVGAAMLKLREHDLRANLKKWRKESAQRAEPFRAGWWSGLTLVVVGLAIFWAIWHFAGTSPAKPATPSIEKHQTPIASNDSTHGALPPPAKPENPPSPPSLPPKNNKQPIASQLKETVQSLLNSPLGYIEPTKFAQRNAGSADPLPTQNAKAEAASALENRDFNSALRWLSRADSTDPQILQMTAHALFGTKRYHEAAAVYSQLTRYERYALDAQWNLAMCYFAQYPDKKEEYQQEIKRFLEGNSRSLRNRAEQWETARKRQMAED